MKPGTSGLRKKVEVWQGLEGDKYYVENFIQSLLDTAAAKNNGKMPETYVYIALKLHDVTSLTGVNVSLVINVAIS